MTEACLLWEKNPDNRIKVLHILREDYLSKWKLKIISLFNNELTSLQKEGVKSISRVKNDLRTLLKTSKMISDSLLIDKVLKCLPSEFEPFTTIINI